MVVRAPGMPSQLQQSVQQHQQQNVRQAAPVVVKQETASEVSGIGSSASVKMELDESELSTDSVIFTSDTSQQNPATSSAGTAAATTGTVATASSEEIRKMKRRQYQQKRRQSVANKELPVGVHPPVGSNQTASTGVAGSTVNIPPSGSTASTSGAGPTATTPTTSAPFTPAKKRSRKGSKYDELDYDAFIETVMAQVRTALPPLTIQEPQLGRGCLATTGAVFGAGDVTPLATRNGAASTSSGNSHSVSNTKTSTNGMLKGACGSAYLPGVSDYYNTKPFGDEEPVTPPATAISTPNSAVGNNTATSGNPNQRGFYHQEFAWPRWDPRHQQSHGDDHQSRSRSSSSCSILLESRGDGCDTPDTVVSSSSPECVLPEPIVRFPGLKFIELAEERANSDSNPDDRNSHSPDIPILVPVPIRPTPNSGLLLNNANSGSTAGPANTPPTQPAVKKENSGPDVENNSENACLPRQQQQPIHVQKNGPPQQHQQQQSPVEPLRDATNVTVTLTLNASAAEDVTQVLCRLAALLRVPPPTGYQIIERTGGGPPPAQRLGLYRFKGKDGKESTPVDIQSILNGTTKFCRHCDVVILGNNKITKKAQLFASAQPSSSAEPTAEKKGDRLTAVGQPDNDDDEEDYHFCSSSCFVQFAVAHNTRPSAIEAKEANTIVAHVGDVTHSSVSGNTGGASAAAASVVAAAAAKALRPSSAEMPVGPSAVAVKAPTPTPTTPTASTPTHSVPKWKGIRYRQWSPQFQQQVARKNQPAVKKMTDNELTEMLYRAAICIRPTTGEKALDKRQCLFCGLQGDGVSDGPARLINYDVDRWVHLNCALWHEEVFEMVNGALMNVDTALKQSLAQTCVHCERNGASVKCFKLRCSSVFHLGCAVKEGCVFLKNKSVYCSQHLPKCSSTSSTSVVDIKEEQLTTLAVYRRVYVNRDENRQVAAVMHQHGSAGDTDAGEPSYLLRVGSLTFLSVGQLLPHQLAAFHSPHCIYPIGYQVVRFYWSPRQLHKRCRYVCSIEECEGRPQFTVVVQEPERHLPDLSFKVIISN